MRRRQPAPETYAEAHRTTVKTGKPMVVMVSTDWCPPCQVMKKKILPRVRQRGLLRKVAFAMVNPDRDGELAEKITGGGPIPQLVMFRKTPHGWMRSKLVGGQTVEAVEQFIKDGLASDAADKKGDKKSRREVRRGPDYRPSRRARRGRRFDAARLTFVNRAAGSRRSLEDFHGGLVTVFRTFPPWRRRSCRHCGRRDRNGPRRRSYS